MRFFKDFAQRRHRAFYEAVNITLFGTAEGSRQAAKRKQQRNRNNMEPDKSEKRVRFGCGFIFGLLVGFFTAITFVMEIWGFIVLIALCEAAVFGLLAMKYGDDFWDFIKRWWLWT